MLTTDGFEDFLLNEVIAQFGQGPPPQRQAKLRGRSVRDPSDGGALLGSQLRRGTASVGRFHDGEPLLVKGMEDGVDGIDVEREAGGDLDSQSLRQRCA